MKHPTRLNVSMVFLVLAILLIWPYVLVSFLVATVQRRLFIHPMRVRAQLDRMGLLEAPANLEVCLLSGGHSNAVALVTQEREGRAPSRVVLKKPLHFGSILAWVGSRFGPMPYAGEIGRQARVDRERFALMHLGRSGVAVPRVLGWDSVTSVLAMECLEGVPFGAYFDTPTERRLAEDYGRTLRVVHESGIALCDGHPGNTLVDARGRLNLLDLEFALHGDAATPARRAFDLAYAACLMTEGEARTAFRRGYGELAPELSTRLVDTEARLREYAPFIAAERGRQERRGAKSAGRELAEAAQ